MIDCYSLKKSNKLIKKVNLTFIYSCKKINNIKLQPLQYYTIFIWNSLLLR